MTDFYRAMSDPIRRKVLKLLAQKEHTQAELVKQFSISQPAMIKHIKLLKEEELILERRVGRYCYYSLNKVNFDANYQAIRQEIESILDDKLNRLKHYAENKKGNGDQNGD